MSRPLLLVFLLMVLLFTSQFEWRQRLTDMDTNPEESQKQQTIPNREEVVKEKIILMQEKKIQKLNDVVRSLEEQVEQCRGTNGTFTPLAENSRDIPED